MTSGLTPEPRVRGRKPPHGEPVLDRAVRILGSFGPAHRTLTLTSLSVRAGLPKATTLRRMPLHSTGVGLILLAYAPRSVQDEVLAGTCGWNPSTPS